MRRWVTFFKGSGNTSCTNRAARNTNPQNQLPHNLYFLLIDVPESILVFHQLFIQHITTLMSAYCMIIVDELYFSVSAGTFNGFHSSGRDVLPCCVSVSGPPVEAHGTFVNISAYRRSFIDAMSRVLRYAGQFTETPELVLALV